MGYPIINSAIYLMAAMSSYTLTLLFSIMPKEGSISKKEELLLWPKDWYDESGKVAIFKID